MRYHMMWVVLLCCVKVLPFQNNKDAHKLPACCTFPCRNGAFCLQLESAENFACTSCPPGYFGQMCHRATWLTWFSKFFKPSISLRHYVLTQFGSLWKFISEFAYMHNRLISFFFLDQLFVADGFAYETLTSLDHFDEHSKHLRSLPPIPVCITQMGYKGPRVLPHPAKIFDRLLSRSSLQPTKHRKNLLFETFGQYFAMQFMSFQEPGYGKKGFRLDMSQLYGRTTDQMKSLRSFKGGKLRTKIFHTGSSSDGEYPPYLTNYQIEEYWSNSYEWIMPGQCLNPKWAFGNPAVNYNSFLFLMGTAWLREHNRLCTKMARRFPKWSDEKLYQTAKLIVIGEMLKILQHEYIPYLTDYKISLFHQPEFLHGQGRFYDSKVTTELFSLLHWAPSLPDYVDVGDITHNGTLFLQSNNYEVFAMTPSSIFRAMVYTKAGDVKHRNFHNSSKNVIMYLLENSRAYRMQSFNNYRRFFGLKPYKSFIDLSNDKVIAKELQHLYLDVNAVELPVGLVLERKSTVDYVGETTKIMVSHWLMHSILRHPLYDERMWNPTVLGHLSMQEIIKKASIRRLICRNFKRVCASTPIIFDIPRNQETNTKID